MADKNDTDEEEWETLADSGFGNTDLDLWNDLEIVESNTE
jgi:hypothetical protein